MFNRSISLSNILVEQTRDGFVSEVAITTQDKTVVYTASDSPFIAPLSGKDAIDMLSRYALQHFRKNHTNGYLFKLGWNTPEPELWSRLSDLTVESI